MAQQVPRAVRFEATDKPKKCSRVQEVVHERADVSPLAGRFAMTAQIARIYRIAAIDEAVRKKLVSPPVLTVSMEDRDGGAGLSLAAPFLVE